MTLQDAIEWTSRNTSDEVVSRLRSRAVAKALMGEIERLQRIIDSRPAINAALPQSYIDWSQSLYQLDITRQEGTN